MEPALPFEHPNACTKRVNLWAIQFQGHTATASSKMELTRFRGHPETVDRRCHDEEVETVCAGVPAAVVGWSMGARLVTALMLDALDMALGQRDARSVIHHSDHGAQYTSIAFGKRCREAGVTLSMGSVGDCYDNALCESFFATIECELIERSTFRTCGEARLAVFDYIEAFYNRKRRHSSLGYVSPAALEPTAEQEAA